MDRFEIAARLREIAELLELRGASRFKVKAFARGARTIEAARAPIETLIADDKLRELPGIGFALASQIVELCTTGSSKLLESLREGLPTGVLELAQVSGVGLHTLRTLSDELGIRSLEDLRAAAQEGRLRSVSGFGEKREAKILEAIARYETRKPQLLLAEGLRLASSIASEIGSVSSVERVDLAGTLRRSFEISDEIDFVVTSADPKSALAAITRLPRWASVESHAEQVARFRLPDGTRVEVTTCTPSDRAVNLIERTGSASHVDRLRQRAAARHCELRDLADERELYARLGLGFIPPELRENVGEIEEAEAGDVLLVEADQIRGFVHCHSTWSDGKNTIEEMARAAQARGAEYITITDHSKTAHYAGGLDVERLHRQWDEIDEVQSRVGIRILKGTEADILADGALDWPESVLERLDVLIVSIHNRYRQDEGAMTQRLLRAVRAPVFKIWGHPLGRLVMSRPPVDCRVIEVLDALASSRGAIEINGDPRRLDLEPSWSREARARGLPFVLSVDAHSERELDNLRYAVGLARRAGLRAFDVLNTRDAASFAHLVRPAW